MAKMSKKMREALIERQIQAAVVGLQIPMMSIVAIYKKGEELLEPGVCKDRQEFVEQLQAFAVVKGATFSRVAA